MVDTVQMAHTVPLSEFVRARLSSRPVAMPVEGVLYARLKHITAVPAPVYQPGYPFSRLQALDTILERMERLGKDWKPPEPGLEAQQQAIEEMTKDIVAKLRSGNALSESVTGFLVDMYL